MFSTNYKLKSLRFINSSGNLINPQQFYTNMYLP